MDRTEKQLGADLPPHAADNLPQLERGLSLNNNPNPQLFVVQDDRPPPGSGDGSESDSGGARTLLGEETYPEGGRVAWLVVFGCWCRYCPAFFHYGLLAHILPVVPLLLFSSSFWRPGLGVLRNLLHGRLAQGLTDSGCW